MKIKKESFVLSVAYWPKDENTKIPSDTNLCKLFWCFIFKFFTVIPFVYVVCSIIIAICFIIGFPFASRPTIFEGNAKFIHYKSWPAIKRHKILPIWLLIFHPLTWHIILGIILCKLVWFIVAIIIMWLAILYVLEKIENSETYLFFKEFLKAKKQKICPIVEIVE